jgi:hypothetical protein
MPSYSDAEMRAIMGRALQIDTGRSDRFTPEQLRTIAAELGISTQALEVAMYEADSKGAVVGMHPTPRGMPGWAQGLAVAVAALVLLVSAFGVMRRTVAPRASDAPVHAEQAARAAPAFAPAAPGVTQPEPARAPGERPIAVKKTQPTTKKQF